MKQRLVFACVLMAAMTLFTPSLQTFAEETSRQDASPTMFFDIPYPEYPIRLKSHGEVVKAIQQQLNADGYFVGADDGVFGPLTLKGVREFQAAHRLKRDGIVGSQTWATLFPTAPTELLARLQRYVGTRSSNVSVAVYNANDKQTDVFNPYETFTTASIVKPLILATLLYGGELHQRLPHWETLLAVPMIEQSNNNDATELWNLAGSATGVQAFTHAANMNDTVPNPNGYWGLTTTSALDQVTLVKDLVFANQVLDASDRNYELNLMHNVIAWQRWGISAGVPETDYVALKNGWLPLQDRDWEINSIGYVAGEGRNYVIAVLTRDNPSEQYGISTVEGVARIVWTTLGQLSSVTS